MKRVELKISSRALYTLLAILIIVLAGMGVYALTAGIAPNPGHTLDSVSAPTGCGGGQFLKWTGSGWSCEAVSVTSNGVYDAPVGQNVVIQLSAASGA